MKSTDNAALAAALKSARAAAGLTQAQLAEQTNLSQCYLSQIEAGARTPSLGTLRRLAQSAGVTVSDLISEVSDAA